MKWERCTVEPRARSSPSASRHTPRRRRAAFATRRADCIQSPRSCSSRVSPLEESRPFDFPVSLWPWKVQLPQRHNP